MKTKLSILLAVLLTAAIFCGCAKNVSLTIRDSGQESIIQTKKGAIVEKVLEDAGISISTKDEVSPTLDSEINEDTNEIVIKRYAKVTVTKGLESKEIELVGETVQDAVDKSGFDMGNEDELDHDAKEYLTDGMTIKILHEVTVTLKADGETKNVKSKAVTVKDFLEEQNVTLSKNDEVSEKPDSLIKDDMEITVKRIEYKEETRTESIDYETVEKSDDSMYKGESKTTQEGYKGEKEVTYKVKYVDGKKEGEEKLDEKVTKEPTDKIVKYGTKAKMLTEDEAEAIAREHWKNPDTSTRKFIVVSDGLKSSGGKEYYGFRFQWLVDEGGRYAHYSTIDYAYVDAYSGEVKSSIY